MSMQSEELNGDTQSFIVRIWHERESGNDKTVGWRGSILHVGSGKRLYFHNLNSIKRFVQELTGMEDANLPDWFRLLIGQARPK